MLNNVVVSVHFLILFSAHKCESVGGDQIVYGMAIKDMFLFLFLPKLDRGSHCFS